MNRLKYPGINREYAERFLGAPITKDNISGLWWWRIASDLMEQKEIHAENFLHLSFILPLKAYMAYGEYPQDLIDEWLGREALMRVHGGPYLPAPLQKPVTVDLKGIQERNTATISLSMSREEILAAVAKMREERGISPSLNRGKRSLDTFRSLEDFDKATLLLSKGDRYRNAFRILDRFA